MQNQSSSLITFDTQLKTTLSGEFKQLLLYRHLKNSGDFNGIRTHDLCDGSGMPHQLSYEPTQLKAGQFVELTRSGQRTDERKVDTGCT